MRIVILVNGSASRGLGLGCAALQPKAIASFLGLRNACLTKKPCHGSRVKIETATEFPMRKFATRSLKLFAAVCFLCLCAAAPIRATVVSWSPGGDKTDGTADSASQSFFSAGPLVAAKGYMVDWPSGSPLAPYYVNHGFDQAAMDIIGPQNQWQENKHSSAQADFGFILSKGLTDGKLQIGSIQTSRNEPLAVWDASNLGHFDVPTGGISTGTADFVSANMVKFATEKFTSIGALGTAAMPAAFPATLTPVPEMGALFPIVGLILAIALTQILRRRRMAQLRATSPSPR